MSDALNSPTFTVAELARRLGAKLRGDGEARLTGVATLERAGPSEVAWCTGSDFHAALDGCRAGAIIGPASLPPTRAPAVLVGDVESAIATVLGWFDREPWRPPVGVDPAARIDPSVRIPADARIGPFVVIGPRTTVGPGTTLHAGVFVGADCALGEGCELWPNVYVGERTRIGQRVTIWPGAVIGRPGFGFIFRDGRHQRVPQIGAVEIEDDVEIGANACVDRAKCGVTRIGRGTKIDNLVQVAHNVEIGPHCILVGQVGLAGSVRLGTGVILGGQVGVCDGLTIGDGARVTAQSGVTKSLEAGLVAVGMPARNRMTARREQAALRRLPEWIDRVRQLAQRVDALEAATDDRKTG